MFIIECRDGFRFYKSLSQQHRFCKVHGSAPHEKADDGKLICGCCFLDDLNKKRKESP